MRYRHSNLPSKNTDQETDSHYRCFACLRGQNMMMWLEFNWKS
jgi:hypothetical protein